MNSRLLLVSACLLAWTAQTDAAQVQLWKWTDANGVVHYSDVPGPGAVRVDVAVNPGTSQPSAPASGSEEGSGRGEGYVQPSIVPYRSLSIDSPADQTSFFDADTVVSVQLSADPALQKGDSLYLFLDGRKVSDSGGITTYSLSSIPRGEHTLQAVIYDSDGAEKIRSSTVTIYMKQTTVIPPNAVGPNLKPPPPKPKPKGS